ncbi:MAG: FAD-dependent oxidoreductase [Polyangiaceae bacterium]
MAIPRRTVLKLLASSAAATGLLVKNAQAGGTDLERDVAIIGGGGAGTYAALRLRDQGKSVAVIERTGRLGGHAQTFHDPASGAPIDIGVIVFPDNSLVRNYFGRFGQPLLTANFAGGQSRYVDFRTGRSVAAFQPGAADLGGALFQYLQILATRFPFLEQNGFQLPPPGPVLDELLLPFGQFAQQNGLNALLPTFAQFEQGFGPLLEATTLYVLKNMSSTVVGALLNSSFLLAPFGVGGLYDAATTALSQDLVMGANILSVSRRGQRVRVKVSTPQGVRTITARKLLFTAPPLLCNLLGFDLDLRELATLARFSSHNYWTAVAKISGMVPGVSLVNASPDTPFNLTQSPGIYSIGPSAAPGLYNVKFGSSTPIPDPLVQLSIRAAVERVALPGISLDFQGFSVFKDHSPYSVVASPREIRAGFYRDLQQLQGHNRTYYAGAAFQTHNSAAIWAYLEELLPTVLT